MHPLGGAFDPLDTIVNRIMFLEPNAQWLYKGYCWDCDFPLNKIYTLRGDTVINDTVYVKMNIKRFYVMSESVDGD